MTLIQLSSKRTLLCLSLYTIFSLFSFVGCVNDVYDSNQKEDGKTPNSFTFSTTSSVQLNVKYNGPKGYKILFEVYLENPFTIDKDKRVVKRTDITPVITRITDENGAYNSKETITADHGDKAYIYTSYIGVPGLFEATIINNEIHANIQSKVLSKAIQTRAATSVPEGYSALGTWDATGRPNFLDTDGKLELSTDILTKINAALPEGGTCLAKYRQAIDFEVKDIKERNTEVFVRFIGGTSTAASMFGYYCYKEGASTADIEKAKKVILFPNTHTLNNNKPIALQGGECVKLHYFNESGEDKGTVFTNGTKIGWFLLNDAFVKSGTGFGAFYSTQALNKEGKNHTAAFRINDFIVLSFEDWQDEDHNDVMFNVWSNPIEAIKPDIPQLPDDPKDPETDTSIAYRTTYNGIVSFEDQWPSKGDYDMNDVIVKYNSVLSFNTKNEVISTEDTFTALWSGASYKNGFAYQLNTDRSNVKTEFSMNPTSFAGQGLDLDLDQATINVFLNAIELTGNNTKKVIYKIKNTFTTPIDHNKFGVPPYNPFIMVNDNLQNLRTEVHLTNHKPTEKANPSLFKTMSDLSNIGIGTCYIAAGNYPFAIHLVNAEEFSTTEKETIDHSYPDFTKWVESDGATNMDWYKKK